MVTKLGPRAGLALREICLCLSWKEVGSEGGGFGLTWEVAVTVFALSNPSYDLCHCMSIIFQKSLGAGAWTPIFGHLLARSLLHQVDALSRTIQGSGNPMLERGQQTVVKPLPPHFVNSLATSLDTLGLTSVQGPKSFLCLLVNSLGMAGLQLFCGPFGPPPLTPEALSPHEVSLTGGLGPRPGSCRPPLSLLVQSLLLGVMASPRSLSAQRPLGNTALCPQSDQGISHLELLVQSSCVCVEWGGVRC